MKFNLKSLAMGFALSMTLLGYSSTILASEQVIITEDYGNPDQVFELLSISPVIGKGQLNEHTPIYQVEKGATLTILNDNIFSIHLEFVDKVGSEIITKDVPDSFWANALKENLTLSGNLYSTEGDFLGTQEFSSFEEAYESAIDFPYYTPGSTVSFNTEGIYAIDYVTGPEEGGTFLLEVAIKKDVVEEKVMEETPKDVPDNVVTEVDAIYGNSTILVNEAPIAIDTYTITNNNYIKLRDFAKMINGTSKQFEVQWNPSKNSIELISNTPYTTSDTELVLSNGSNTKAVLNPSSIYKDGELVDLTAYTIHHNNYFKLRDLTKVFNLGLTWNAETNTIELHTNLDYQE